MKLNQKQQEAYDRFYETTIDDGVLDSRTELLVGLAAAMAMNCQPCTAYYLKRCKTAGVPKEQIQSTLAKVMAVAAGQKRLQAEETLRHLATGY
ncbi:carboxymuconolactone decarboxylase family protein [Pelagicoccus sp. SDUM812003]|uniref:carboxymuconolactone decarboxylase family protein n=1 Tax=Pelagicoccus sp. SDUM812003 TaxID=3041267 RepID=UPI00280CF6F7|nr:carboxymuconolactone decarboxylase family protein [Pelagicoccus sp. SDUM812003]MDQ8205166.1 carboxymuconolactone decarboxylase family protein [Pelagicoccus sp. SDUM812003]